MKKKALSLLPAAAMVCTMSATAFAAEESAGIENLADNQEVSWMRTAI